MFQLTQVSIEFLVIMLLLSYLVKSLTSVVKNHFDYYSQNLKREVERLVDGTLSAGGKRLEEKSPLLQKIQWRRLGEDYLNKENMEWLLKMLGATDEALKNLEGRLELHRTNVRYAFEKRTKNISLALGLGLCLFLNINAFSIWDTLYNDQQARSKFSSPTYVESTLELVGEYDKDIKNLDEKVKIDDKATEEMRAAAARAKEQQKTLQKQRNALQKQIHHFRGEVAFGIGKIWTERVTWWPGFFYEFLGSLLTGVLVSIGAPYWHDLLRKLTAFRQPKKA
jgi:tetratricopeptide (TPR) repeat protein